MIENLFNPYDGAPPVYSERLLEPLKQGRAKQLGRKTEDALAVAEFLMRYDVTAMVTPGTQKFSTSLYIPDLRRFGENSNGILWPTQWVVLTPWGPFAYSSEEFHTRFYPGPFGSDPQDPVAKFFEGQEKA